MLGTGLGENSGEAVGTGKMVTQHQRSKALPASFETFVAAIEELNKSPHFTAYIRESDSLIEFIPLVKSKYRRQWGYLNSETRQRREVIIADIFRNQHVSSLIEFQKRQGESFKLAIVSTPNGDKLSNDTLYLLLRGLSKKDGRWENIKPLPASIHLITLKHTWSSIETFFQTIKAKMEDNQR
jgi:hypothetical protein